jgi:hypothetical protein
MDAAEKSAAFSFSGATRQRPLASISSSAQRAHVAWLTSIAARIVSVPSMIARQEPDSHLELAGSLDQADCLHLAQDLADMRTRRLRPAAQGRRQRACHASAPCRRIVATAEAVCRSSTIRLLPDGEPTFERATTQPSWLRDVAQTRTGS